MKVELHQVTICMLYEFVLTMSMTLFFNRILSIQRMSVSLLVVLILQSTWLLKCTMTTLLEYKVRMLQQLHSNGMVLVIWHCRVFINETVSCSTHTVQFRHA